MGAIHHALLDAGAISAIHVDASAEYIKVSRAEVANRHHDDRVRFIHADFVHAASELPRADIVTLDRVICCYPDMPKLAGAAADRARGLLVMSFPNRRWWTRLGLSIANFGFRVIRLQFRVFLHPPALVLATVEQRGFKTRLNQPGLLWQVVALERNA